MQSDNSPIKHHHFIILSLILGIILPLLDATIIGVAIPSLSQSLSISAAQLQWIATVYTLSAAITIPLCAWAIHRIGSRTVWQIGLLIFTIGSLFCGFSTSFSTLIIARIIQGVGAGLLMPVMQPVLLLAVGQKRFKSAMAAVAVPTVVAPILGPIVAGGILSVTHWHWLFLINIPIALIALCFSLYFLPKDSRKTKYLLDIKGFILYSVSIVLIIYSLVNISHLKTLVTNDTQNLMIIFVTGIVIFACFLKYCLIRKNTLILNINLFRIPSFSTSCSLLLVSSIIFYAGLLVLPLFFISQYTYSTFYASLFVSLSGVGTLISRSFIKKLSEKWGISTTAIFAIIALLSGTLPLFWNGLSHYPLLVAVCMLVRGAGIGLLTLLAMTHAYHDIPSDQVADASAWSRVLTMLGASFAAAGVAILLGVDIGGHQNQFMGVLIGLTLGGILCLIPALKLKKLT